MLSLDFLVGFTIFLLALIMVVSMVPGLLVGLGSSGIDYDAVAYRTGVILVEDPGWPAKPEYPTWELIDVGNKMDIERMGLAVSRDAPNILLSTKVEKFFNDTFFDRDDYRNKVIFGDIYSYNISLWSLDGTYYKTTGDPLPADYGYIRRVVKIKEPSWTEINSNFTEQYTIPDPPGSEWNNSTARNFTVRFDFSQLLDQTINPAYRIDPSIESVKITITDFGDYLNGSYKNATLRNVTLYPLSEPPDCEGRPESELYTLHIDGNSSNLTPNTPVGSTISLVLKPAVYLEGWDDEEGGILNPYKTLDVQFNFEDYPPRTNITGTHHYDYTNAARPPLKPAVLEVAIW